MRIGVCDGNGHSRKQLVRWIRQFCAAYEIEPEIAEYQNRDEFFHATSLRRFSMVFLGLDGPEGFLCARHLWEKDKQVKLVFISDTNRYAVGGVRLHFTDYIVRPVEFRHVVRAMRLASVPGEN